MKFSKSFFTVVRLR